MAWIYLLIAGIFEIGFTSLLKLSDGFTKLYPSLGFVVLGGFSFYFLTLAMKTIALGTAYAVWTGLGALGTAIIGMIYFGDPANFGRIFFLGLLIVSIIGIKLVSKS